MIGHLLYLIGPPGVGKSTLARQLTEHWDREVDRTAPVPHSVLRQPRTGQVLGLELGVPRPDFPGTDSLSMSISPAAREFLLGASLPFALGEGARLATRPFLGALAQAGVDVVVVSLSAPEELLDARWKARGAKQSPAWRKGALTRAERLFEWALSTPGIRTVRSESARHEQLYDLREEIREVFPHIDPGVRA